MSTGRRTAQRGSTNARLVRAFEYPCDVSASNYAVRGRWFSDNLLGRADIHLTDHSELRLDLFLATDRLHDAR